MGNNPGKLENLSDPLTGPAKIMAEKWGKCAVEEIPLWHAITEGVFPLQGTLSTDCLNRCRILLQEREAEVKKKRKRKKINWHSFQKWEREAEVKEKKCTAGLMVKLEKSDGEEVKKGKKKRRVRNGNLPPPYAVSTSVGGQAAAQPSGAQVGATVSTQPQGSSEEEQESEAEQLYPDLSSLYITPKAAKTQTEKKTKNSLDPVSRTQSPLAATFDYWLRSQNNRGDAHQMPMMTFPNPQPMPQDGQAQANWNPEVLVYRPWQPDELKEVADELPDPQKTGGEKWVTAMQQLLTMYNPTLQEVEAVCRRFFKLRWANIRPTAWSTTASVGSQQFSTMMDTLYDAVRTAFPLRVCWPEIHNTRQKEGESVADYRTRMETVFAAHSGIDSGNAAYTHLLKTALVNGLQPGLRSCMMTSCVGWETETLPCVWTHVLHAERNRVEADTNQVKNLQTAQLMYYQQEMQTFRRGQRSRQNTQRGWDRYQGFPQNQFRRGQPNTDVQCYICGRYGHISRTCPTNKRRNPEEPQMQEKPWPHAPPQGLAVHSPGLQAPQA